jgi:tRNA threonylcarbamoyladenosine biosynthesis protein TsaB
MLVAAVDTATLTLSCALVEIEAGGATRLRCERTEHLGAAPGAKAGRREAAAGAPREPRSTHSARLPQVLVELLQAEGLAIPDLGGYAVGLGPGSFTGLRIGLATWKGLAYANRKPIAGASSLAAMALAAAPDAEPGAVLVPLLDAKKGEVYAGFYRVRARPRTSFAPRSGAGEGDGGIVEVADDAALPPAALAARLEALRRDGARPLAFGDGLAAYPAPLAGVPRLATEVASPPALAVAALVAERLAPASYDAQALFALEPRYVRPSEAELKFPKGLGPGAEKS